jgi:hypothetical protein
VLTCILRRDLIGSSGASLFESVAALGFSFDLQVAFIFAWVAKKRARPFLAAGAPLWITLETDDVGTDFPSFAVLGEAGAARRMIDARDRCHPDDELDQCSALTCPATGNWTRPLKVCVAEIYHSLSTRLSVVYVGVCFVG